MDDEAFTREIGEMAGKLEYWDTQRGVMQQRMAQWLPSPAFADSYYADAHPPAGTKGGPARTYGTQSPEMWAAYQQLAGAGQVWFGQAVMTNPAFGKLPDASLPCLVLVPVDQSPHGLISAGFMAGILYDIYSGKEKAADYPRTAAILQDDQFQFFRRDVLPAEELRGFEGVLLNVLLRERWMPPEAEMLFVPLLADPGPSQAVVQIPWAMAAGRPLQLGEMKPGRYAEAPSVPGPRPGLPPRLGLAPPAKKTGCFGWGVRVVALIWLAAVLIGVIKVLLSR